MKLIAKRHFRNPGRKLEIPNATHPDHVHMGARFSIGADLPFEKLSKEDRKLVGLLAVADCISDPDKPEVVAAIETAVAEEKARDKKVAAFEAQVRRNPLPVVA